MKQDIPLEVLAETAQESIAEARKHLGRAESWIGWLQRDIEEAEQKLSQLKKAIEQKEQASTKHGLSSRKG